MSDDNTPDQELVRIFERMAFQLLRLSEIAEAQNARAAGTVADLRRLRTSAAELDTRMKEMTHGA